jgi:sulfide:quinone oxidoreductase
MSDKFDVLIVGGGTAGISVAARLLNVANPPTVGIIEPADKHYYQPIWTLVGGGVFPRETSEHDMADVMPPGANWIKDRVEEFDPDNNTVKTAAGKTLHYETLVVAAGIQLNWSKIEGLPENLGRGGVCSNYSYDTVEYTWECIRNFKGGNAVFTFPSTPIKCAGAPQKIMWLAEHAFRKAGVRKKTNVIYASATESIFGVPKYRAPLQKLEKERDIDGRYKRNLVALRPDKKEAVFEKLGTDERETIEYDMIHVTPPQSAPDFVAKSKLANDAGWVDVDKHTTQHVKYKNVFSLGDCSSLPTSKTGAAVRKEAPVTVENLMAFRAHRPLTGHYDGYASCPLVTGYGKVMLAEFGYDGKIMESFPFDQAQERYSMYVLKAYGLPAMYWNGMMRGRM